LDVPKQLIGVSLIQLHLLVDVLLISEQLFLDTVVEFRDQDLLRLMAITLPIIFTDVSVVQ